MAYLWAALAAFTVVFIIAGDNIFSVTSYNIRSRKVKEKSRFMLISDVHSKRIAKRISVIMKKYKPDAVIIAGDLWDRKKGHIKEGISFVSDIARQVPVVYTPGNHDYTFLNRERMLKALEDVGAYVLRADAVRLSGIEVIGLDRLGYANFADSVLGGVSAGFRLMVTHFPQYFHDEYSCYDVDLVLCGHAHGGQFRIPFMNRGLYSPGQGIFPKYSEGLHEHRGTKLIVSRGIGNSNRFPFRLFNPPEAVIIDIVPEDAK